MLTKIKQFLVSRAKIRFYRVIGFGFLSVIVIELIELVPQLTLIDQYESGLILILTAILTATDKKRRDLKSN